MSDTDTPSPRPPRAASTFPQATGTRPAPAPGALELDISLGQGNRLFLKGSNIDLAELEELLEAFFTAAGAENQTLLDALTKRITKANGALEARIIATTPEGK